MATWNPWRELRERRSSVELWFAPLDGVRGLWTCDGDREDIYLDERLGRRERREVLAHELVHGERRIGHGAATEATMEREEQMVWRSAMVRLVPPVEVLAFVRRRLSAGPVTVDDLAEEFDLSHDGVRLLIRVLREEHGLTRDPG